jgi:hypothetical protein
MKHQNSRGEFSSGSKLHYSTQPALRFGYWVKAKSYGNVAPKVNTRPFSCFSTFSWSPHHHAQVANVGPGWTRTQMSAILIKEMIGVVTT